MQITQLLSRTEQLHGDATATICSDRKRSWSELARNVRCIAAGLREAGAVPGDRIAIISQNSDHYIDLYFAVPWIGAVMVPLNTRWSVPELADCLDDCQPTFVLYDCSSASIVPSLIEQCSSAIRKLDIVSLCRSSGTKAICPPFRRKDDAMAGIFYTGGTTGRSKGVILSERNLMANALTTALEFGYRADTVYLHSAPMFHLGDGASTYAVSMMGGAHAILQTFHPRDFLATVQKHAVTHAMLAPTMIQSVLDDDAFACTDTQSLQRLIYGTSPMPPRLLEDALAALPGTGFVQGYGMTELSPLATVLSPAEHLTSTRRLRSAGRPAYGVDVQVVGPEGIELDAGDVGEIRVRGANVMQGYWRRPDETAAALRDGWMHTGDCGYFDRDGFLYVVDRLKDMIITGGENVYSIEVENALTSHPAVAQCAVIGVPHRKWGEAVLAVVVPNEHQPAIDQAALIDHCRNIIAGYKLPKGICFASGSLPVNAAGKVLKSELKQIYEDYFANQREVAD
ncbi:long-chain fatty acid--CoA ligase [Erythrobacter sp. AP23]|uniref:acyl-CoA synthetase n=1 Tax=Erythrobacter sp. AP23 TaxID=499656 RepID=UPI00076D2F50|nr:long-chain fatty acid--CoA ligase [Erythrobacter sp. AP23]KWV93772.1 hypothetical protein ASS64_12820 [Erythrobacter sp. AP23]